MAMIQQSNIIQLIFQYLQLDDLDQSIMVCWNWYKQVSQPLVWKNTVRMVTNDMSWSKYYCLYAQHFKLQPGIKLWGILLMNHTKYYAFQNLQSFAFCFNIYPDFFHALLQTLVQHSPWLTELDFNLTPAITQDMIHRYLSKFKQLKVLRIGRIGSTAMFSCEAFPHLAELTLLMSVSEQTCVSVTTLWKTLRKFKVRNNAFESLHRMLSKEMDLHELDLSGSLHCSNSDTTHFLNELLCFKNLQSLHLVFECYQSGVQSSQVAMHIHLKALLILLTETCCVLHTLNISALQYHMPGIPISARFADFHQLHTLTMSFLYLNLDEWSMFCRHSRIRRLIVTYPSVTLVDANPRPGIQFPFENLQYLSHLKTIDIHTIYGIDLNKCVMNRRDLTHLLLCVQLRELTLRSFTLNDDILSMHKPQSLQSIFLPGCVLNYSNQLYYNVIHNRMEHHI